jgi:hypothetical protein
MTASEIKGRKRAVPLTSGTVPYVGGKYAGYGFTVLDGKGKWKYTKKGSKMTAKMVQDCGPKGFNCINHKFDGGYTVITDSTGLVNTVTLTLTATLYRKYNKKNSYGFIVNLNYNSNNTATESFIVNKEKDGSLFWEKNRKPTMKSYISKKPILIVREDPLMGYKKMVDKCAPWKLRSFKIEG